MAPAESLEGKMVKEVKFISILVPDIDKLKALSPEQFNMYYLNEMQKHFDGHLGLFNRNPVCNCCRKLIDKPEILRRYLGQDMHAQCFTEVYSKERNRLNESDREYFDLVYRLRQMRLPYGGESK